MAAPAIDVDAIAAAVAARLAPRLSLVTVGELCDLYAASPEAKRLKAWKTEQGRMRHISRIIGARSAAALTMRDIDDIRAALAGVSPATRNRVAVRLTAMLRWAVDRKIIGEYPLPRMKLEPESNGRSTWRTEADIRKVAAALAARGRHAIAAVVVTAFDGMLRRGEVCKLRLAQLDDANGAITLYASETKAQKDRVTVFSAWASDMIRNVPRPLGCPWAFPSGRGVPYYPRTILRYYQEACDEASVAAAPGERNWMHDTRAGGATKQIELGTPVPHVMQMAGWEDYRTMKRYMRAAARDVATAAAQRLDKTRRRGPRRALTLVQDVGDTTPNDELHDGKTLQVKTGEA